MGIRNIERYCYFYTSILSIVNQPCEDNSASNFRSEPYLVISGKEATNSDHRLSSNDLRISNKISEDEEEETTHIQREDVNQNNNGVSVIRLILD